MMYYSHNGGIIVTATSMSNVVRRVEGNKKMEGVDQITPLSDINNAWIALLLPFLKNYDYVWLDSRHGYLHFGFCVGSNQFILTVGDVFEVLIYNRNYQCYTELGVASLHSGHVGALLCIRRCLGQYARYIVRKAARNIKRGRVVRG